MRATPCAPRLPLRYMCHAAHASPPCAFASSSPRPLYHFSTRTPLRAHARAHAHVHAALLPPPLPSMPSPLQAIGLPHFQRGAPPTSTRPTKRLNKKA
eukprot:7107014-Prymnesium_polylepis.1